MIITLIIVVFVLIISTWLAGQSEWHLNRNKHNRLPQGSLKRTGDKLYADEAGLLWELQPHIKNKFHQPGREIEKVNNPYSGIEIPFPYDPKNPNLKFLCKTESGGSYEAIMQPDGKYLTEGPKQGTYNYSHPGGFSGSLKHVLLDVLPHFINDKYKS